MPTNTKAKAVMRGGLQHDVFVVIAGHHRFAAARSLGWETIPAVVVNANGETTDIENQISAIDENLCRAELSKADRAKQMKRRKDLYLALHPETRHGENQHTRSGKVCHSSEPADRFTEDTSTKTGVSERKVRLDAERGEKITDEALDAIAGSPVDKGVFLDEVKNVPREDQVSYVEDAIAQHESAPKRAAKGGIAPLTPEEEASRIIAAIDALSADARTLVYEHLMRCPS